MTAIPLSDGFRIERSEERTQVRFTIFEDGGPTWPDGSPRGGLDVTVYKPDVIRKTAEVSCPSTSDKRPALARALAVALLLAGGEADQMEPEDDNS